MPQSLPTPRPHEIEKTGDDTPASSLYRYVWRMSEWHQVWASLIAAATAALAFAPLELQRRIIDNAIETASTDILVMLSVVFLAVLLVQGGLKFALRIYQGWLSESAIRYTREHMSSIYAFRVASGDRAAFSPGKDDGDPQTSDDEAGDGDLERGGGTEAADGGRAVSIIGAEVDKLGAFVGEAFVAPVVNVGTVLALLGYMLYVDTWIALVSLIFLAPQIALTPLIQRRINRLTERRLSLMRELGGLVANEPRDSTLPDGETFQSNIAGLFRRSSLESTMPSRQTPP